MNVFEKIYRDLILNEAVTSRETARPEDKNILKAGKKRATAKLKSGREKEIEKQTPIHAQQQAEHEASGYTGHVKFTAHRPIDIRYGNERDPKFVLEAKTGVKALYNITEDILPYLMKVIQDPEKLKRTVETLNLKLAAKWKQVKSAIGTGGIQPVKILAIEDLNKELKLKPPFKIYLGRNPQGQPVVAWHQAGYAASAYAIMDYCVKNKIDIQNPTTPQAVYLKTMMDNLRNKMNMGEVKISDEDYIKFLISSKNVLSELDDSNYTVQVANVQQTLKDEEQSHPFTSHGKEKTVTGQPTHQTTLTKPEKPIN